MTTPYLIVPSRRRFVAGFMSALAAPVIIPYGRLMPVRALPPPELLAVNTSGLVIINSRLTTKMLRWNDGRVLVAGDIEPGALLQIDLATGTVVAAQARPWVRFSRHPLGR
jgi:hypothetical protein